MAPMLASRSSRLLCRSLPLFGASRLPKPSGTELRRISLGEIGGGDGGGEIWKSGWFPSFVFFFFLILVGFDF